MDSLNNKKVLTFKEGCLYTGFAPSYMYKLTSAGIVPFSKPNGKTIFFDRERLERWLLSNGTKSNEQKESEAATYVTTHNNSHKRLQTTSKKAESHLLDNNRSK